VTQVLPAATGGRLSKLPALAIENWTVT